MSLIKTHVSLSNEKGEIEYEQDGHSWTVQFLQLLYVNLSQITQTIKDVTNTTRSISVYTNISLSGPAANSNYGIMPGTGTTAESVTDYVLATKIAHGNSAGQLSYGATGWVDASTVGTTVVFSLSRPFTNNTASTITINEIGLVSVSPSYYILIARDVLDTGVDVEAAATKTITYTITVDNAG